jgi:hypothetical protein
MKQILITIGGALLLVSVLVWVSGPGDVPAPDAEGSVSLTADETVFDFGSISMARGVVTHKFPIRGAGTVSRLSTSCMCTKATLVINGSRTGPFGMAGHGIIPRIAKTMAAGDEVFVDVAFDPAAHGPAGLGRVERTVTVEAADGRPLTLRFTAFVTP